MSLYGKIVDGIIVRGPRQKPINDGGQWYEVVGFSYNRMTETRSDTWELIDGKIVFTITPRPDADILVDRKAIAVDSLNTQAKSMLDENDWKVLRHLEEVATSQTTTMTNAAFNSLASGRAQIRTVAKNRIVSVNQCVDLAELEALWTNWYPPEVI